MSTNFSNSLNFGRFKGYSHHWQYRALTMTGNFREHAVFTLLTLGYCFVHALLCILDSKLI